MNENRAKNRKKAKRGRPPKHGGYSLLATKEMPENRKHVIRYLTQVREGLIEDLGPTEGELSTGQRVLIDRIVSKLGVVRCIEEHIRENAVMEGKDLAPSLKTSYLAYNNSIRLDLMALGIDTRAIEDKRTPLEIAGEIVKQKSRRAKS
jgi:hypothetical protein